MDRAKERDRLTPFDDITVNFEGYLGSRITGCIDNRVMAQHIEKIIKPFRERNERDFGHWRCEYWGKWYTSAVLGAQYQPNAQHLAIVERGLEQLLETQSANGYIGTYVPDAELGGWDVWGRKYVLLGLIAHYDFTGSKTSLEAACAELDYLMTQIGPGKANIADNGLDLLMGLSSNSILEPVALLYQRTGEKKYLAFAEYIVAQWEKPSAFSTRGLQLVRDAINGVPPIDIASPKAYEMMSCYEGLCELYRSTGNEKYRTAVIELANGLLENEIMITGSGSNQELWFDGKRQQTQIMEQPVETCVTTTWIKLCYQLLRLTGDPKWADEMEISLYNALLGAMTPNGEWWSYYAPLCGERVHSKFQHQDVELSCCVANGPRGLLLTPRWAVMQSANGIAVNLYSKGAYVTQLTNGVSVELMQETEYPENDRIVIHVSPSQETEFSVDLRIPAWSNQVSLSVNGQPVSCSPGTYASLTRTWKKGDRISLQLDLRGRVIPAPNGAPELAVMRGPVVLAMDNRMVVDTGDPHQAIWLKDPAWLRQKTSVRPDYPGAVYPSRVIDPNDERYVELVPLVDKPDGVWMAFETDVLIRPSHFFNHQEKSITLCDYASAGNRFSSENVLRVWMPQPLLLSETFPQETWKLYHPLDDKRPTYKPRNTK